MKNALIIDDDKNILTTLEIYLEELGFSVQTAITGSEGVEKFIKQKPEMVFLDMKLPDLNGLEVLKKIMETDIPTNVIIITAYAAIDTAVKAIKQGAFEYLPKPFTPAQIDHLVGMVEKVRSLEAEIRSLKGIVQEGELTTRSRKMHALLNMARQVAETNAAILITGESGTGKGLLARLIHDWSSRAGKPFITVDCAVLQENLLESDLFGHKKGAFTGALQDKVGKLNLADGGSVFLDEISEMAPAIQAKFLRFLQYKEFERVGDPTNIRVDVRVITATNRNLEELVQIGAFRQDLLFRLNVVEIDLPPLRDRPEDIDILADQYLQRFSKLYKKPVQEISADVLQVFQHYSWPGNVRELVNVIERGTILCRGKQLLLADLPAHIVDCKIKNSSQSELQNLVELEKTHIQRVLASTTSMEEAARILGIDPATLWRKRKKYHLD
ncbi:sigma-54 dependent DNA-binding response regulator [Candidatus Vecturithrix granuli]|uniref:Sigma-54 dependent DNA-binding response regulator n=1 Tax=Vecturithrix granuli TaxID=1499967 RepID=A0A081C6W2_VECG1|nr:sigma-54 dependent DNA-binding response regulator [Candidatus Vecturithrix granuli]